MRIPLPRHINFVIDKLYENNFEAYVVGGCVRNGILNLPVKDYDITTNATPQETIKVFSDYKVIETGIKHGTVTLIIEGNPIEITTYRTDGEYLDNRHPSNVTFTKSLKEDLSRRDFTVNALAYNEKDGLIDHFGGMDDIKNKRICAVGDADKRFNEDSLRILRALRFASVYGFEIEEETSKAMIKNRELIKNISIERITNELNGFIVGDNAGKLLSKYKKIFAEFIPEIVDTFDLSQDNPYHDKDVWEHTCSVVENSDNDLAIRLSALFHDLGKSHCKTIDSKGIGHFYGHPEISEKLADKIMNRLRQPKALTFEVIHLVKYHDRLRDIGIKGMRRLYGKIGKELMQKLIKLARADSLGQSDYNKDFKAKSLKQKEEMLLKIIEEKLCCTVADLKINGNDLKACGIKEGRAVGETLNFLLEAVIGGKVKNEKESLINYIKTKNTGKL